MSAFFKFSESVFSDFPLKELAKGIDTQKLSSKELDSSLVKALSVQGENQGAAEKRDLSDSPERKPPIQNKLDGLQREQEVRRELADQYPESQGYSIVSEAYLRDHDGNIVKDSVSGNARRIDFVVIKNGEVVDSIEVTSTTADKTAQTAKENRIREAGGTYIKSSDGTLVRIPENVSTRIERRD